MFYVSTYIVTVTAVCHAFPAIKINDDADADDDDDDDDFCTDLTTLS